MADVREGAVVRPVPAAMLMLAGCLLVLASAQYLAGEAIAASAWRDPAYNYAFNFISDLGYRGEPAVFMEREIYSPLHWFMNGAFVLFGALSFAAAALQVRSLTTRLSRTLFLAIYGAQLVGLVLLAIFPESPEGLANGMMVFHAIGAVLAIVGGNLGAILAGRWREAVDLPRWLVRTGLVLGVLGILALVGFSVAPTIANGFVERIAVYTITVWNVVWGLSLVRLSRG